MKILLIDNYDSFTYNLYHYISNFKKNIEVVRNDKIDGETILRKKYDKIVISPGPGNPSQAGNCIKIVRMYYWGFLLVPLLFIRTTILTLFEQDKNFTISTWIDLAIALLRHTSKSVDPP